MRHSEFQKRARFLRESSQSSDIEKTLNVAAKVLGTFDIPHLVCGGYAVQEHGYARFTSDVDIIVPDVQQARERLALNGFRENPGSKMTVTNRVTKVEIDLLPGGGRVGPGPIALPTPTQVSKTPRIIDLPRLLTIKLSSYMGSPVHRAKDFGDVVELIKANDPPRDLAVDSRVRELYQKTWDQLHEQQLDVE